MYNFALVAGVVTDNAAANRAAWRILEERFKDTMLICYGCGSHATNLLMKNIIQLPWTHDAIQPAIDISKYFRSHPAIYAAVTGEGSEQKIEAEVVIDNRQSQRRLRRRRLPLRFGRMVRH